MAGLTTSAMRASISDRGMVQSHKAMLMRMARASRCHLLIQCDWVLASGTDGAPVMNGVAAIASASARVLMRRRREREREI